MLTSLSIDPTLTFTGPSGNLVLTGTFDSANFVADQLVVYFNSDLIGADGTVANKTILSLPFLGIGGGTVTWNVAISRYNNPSVVSITRVDKTTLFSDVFTHLSPSIGNATAVLSGGIADKTPPTLTGLVLPSIVTKGIAIAVTVRATDPAAGVDRVVIGLNGPDGSRTITVTDAVDSFSDGVSRLSVPTTSLSAGEYTVNSVQAFDKAGNTQAYWNSDLLAMGASTSIIITSGTTATAGDDVLVDRTAGGSVMSGLDGNDTLYGQAGNDTFIGGPGADRFIGGDGIDTADYSGLTSAVVTTLGGALAYTRLPADSDSLVSIENLVGTAYGDVLVGYSNANVLTGGSGDDTLDGGAGADTLDGGDGLDTVGYASAHSGITLSLTTPADNKGDAAGDVFTSIEAFIGSGYADSMTGDAGANRFDGGDGNDTLAGNDSDDTLSGGVGNDSVDGGLGSDSLDAGVGADTVLGGDGTDMLLGGAGNDSLDGGLGVDRLFGGDNADTLVGGEGDDSLDGGAANDSLDGGLGADILVAGDGADSVLGGDGADSLLGGAGADSLDGGVGADTLVGGDDADTLVGGDGNDTLDGGAANDRLDGSVGNDTLAGGLGDDTLLGGTDTAAFDGGDGTDTVSFAGATRGITVSMLGPQQGTGDELGDTFTSIEAVVGSSYDDVITGDATAMTFDSGAGADSIDAGDSNDTFLGGAGADSFSGGGGLDVVTYAAAFGAVTVALDGSTAGTGLAAGDVLTSVEAVVGSAYADKLIGDAGANTLDGGSGYDTLVGGEGGDSLVGGLGLDTASYANASTGVLASLLTPANNSGDAAGDSYASIENLLGSSGNDTLVGDNLANVLDGNGGADEIHGMGGNDTIVAHAGDQVIDGGTGIDTLLLPDSIGDGSAGVALSLAITDAQAMGLDHLTVANIENVTGTLSSDALTGDDAANVLTGRGGDDTLDGGAGNDRLDGGLGADNLLAGNGADTLLGGDGADSLDGGTGYDSLDGGLGADTLAGGDDADTLGGGGGDDSLDGGAGSDMVVFSGRRTDYTVTDLGDGSFSVADLRYGAPDGTDTVRGAELFRFTDRTVTTAYITFNSAPTGVALSNTAVPENSPAGTVVGTLSAIDADVGDSHTFKLVGGATGLFEIVGNQLRVKAGAKLNFESVASYTVQVQATDVIGLTYTQALTITVRDVNEAPTAVTVNAVVHSIAENTAVTDRLQIATVSVTDDALGSNTLSLSGADAGHFELDGTTVYLKAGTALDYETKSAYSIQVGATDLTIGSAPVVTTSFTLLVSNVAGSTISDGSASDLIVGTGEDDSLHGNDGNDTLDGGVANDAMYGGKGDDLYIVDNPGDYIVESANAGTDTVNSSVSFRLSAHTENLVLTGSDNLSGYGNDLNNRVVGSSGDNFLDGGTGADTLIGGDGNDTYYLHDAPDVVIEQANGGRDTVLSDASYTLGANVENLTLRNAFKATNATGNALDNLLHGDDYANVLDGRAGADTMYGHGGADTYIVDNAGDAVIEASSDQGAVDVVKASVSFILGDYLENLVLTGAGNIDGTGNALANRITGNAGNNVIDGGGGIDTLIGGGGSDTLSFATAGSAVTARLVAGANAVLGGAASGNRAAGFANLRGSDFADTLTGDSGNNVIDGRGGADTMAGGLGDDAFVVDNVGDRVSELANQGVDTVLATISFDLAASAVNVERLKLLGGAIAIDGMGSSAANLLVGNDGDNRLDGRAGNDTLTGGGGSDRFVFDTALAAGNIDRITDFSAGIDVIELDRSVFGALSGATGVLSGQFVAGTKSLSADDHILYNRATGALLFDADGSGAGKAVQFATLATNLSLHDTDFRIS